MRIISKARLRNFWENSRDKDAEVPLRAWYSIVGKARWKNWGDVRAVYRSADLVGDCVVFNIAGNKYRLIVRIRYGSRKVYLLKVMTHGEYDKGTWVDECGCHRAPPKRRTSRRSTNGSKKRSKKRK